MAHESPGRPSQAEAEAAIRTLLSWLGEDPQRTGLGRTPSRVLRAYADWFAGYRDKPEEILGEAFPRSGGYRRMVMLRDIEFVSHCEHHLAPIIGRAHVAYLPDERLVGISKIARLVEVLTRRLQVQERLTMEIAQNIHGALQPRGVAVVVEAKHHCMTTRGVNKPQIHMVTSEMLGVFDADDALRGEFLAAIGNPC